MYYEGQQDMAKKLPYDLKRAPKKVNMLATSRLGIDLELHLSVVRLDFSPQRHQLTVKLHSSQIRVKIIGGDLNARALMHLTIAKSSL